MQGFWSSFRDCFRLPDRRLWRVLLILLAGKALYLVFRGVTHEMDTMTYLDYLVPFHHPPLYAWFLHLLRWIHPDVYLIAGVQVLIFAAAATLFIGRFLVVPWQRYAAALLFAVDPTTSFFCVNLMSEGLFVPLLLIWAGLLDGYLEREGTSRLPRLLFWIALVTGLLYATRLVAIIFVPLIPILHACFHRNLRSTAWHAVLFVLAFQVVLVPVKLVYLQQYGSFSVSLFTGTPLWNSASVLYPDSSVRRNPETEFERFLAARNITEFTAQAAFNTDALFDPDRAYDQFLRLEPRNPDELRQLEESLSRTSRRIILENPVGYVKRFVVPNFLHGLRADEEILISPHVSRRIENGFGYRQRGHVRYHSLEWQVWFGLLVAATAIHSVRGRGGRGATVLLAGSWYHTLVLPVLATVFLRYALIVAPWILMATCLVVLGLSSNPTSGTEMRGAPASRRAGDG